MEDHLRHQAEGPIRLYQRFVELVEARGPFTYAVSKTMITFKGKRRGFAGALPTRRGLSGYLDLQRVVKDPRLISSAPSPDLAPAVPFPRLRSGQGWPAMP